MYLNEIRKLSDRGQASRRQRPSRWLGRQRQRRQRPRTSVASAEAIALAREITPTKAAIASGATLTNTGLPAHMARRPLPTRPPRHSRRGRRHVGDRPAPHVAPPLAGTGQPSSLRVAYASVRRIGAAVTLHRGHLSVPSSSHIGYITMPPASQISSSGSQSESHHWSRPSTQSLADRFS
jgi:hypothetical protein